MNMFLKFAMASALSVAVLFGVAQARQVGPLDGAETQVADRGDHDGGRGGKHHGGKHGGKHGGGHGVGRGEHRGMQMLDVNGDGVIGDEEGAAMADHAFTRFDADKDTKLTEAEYLAGHAQRGSFGLDAAELEAVQKVRKEKFAGFDTNKDASLDKTEYFAASKAKLMAADADKDGKVTPWEFRAAN